MQDCYTKSDLMGALTKLKTPHPREAIAEWIAQMRFGVSTGLTMNDTLHVRLALIGAEALIQTLTEGLDAPRARTALTDALGEEAAKDVGLIPDYLGDLEKALADA